MTPKKIISPDKMKQPKLRIRPVKQTKKEKQMAKLTEKWINFEYEKHKDFIEALWKARILIEQCYGIKTIDQPWELILQVYVNKAIGSIEEKKANLK